jgi:Ca2+/Na+ antiporter
MPWLIIRDSVTYIVALSMVTVFMFINGGEINLYESCGLLFFYLVYILYVVYSPTKPLTELRERRRTLSHDIVSSNNHETSPLVPTVGASSSQDNEEGGNNGEAKEGDDSVADLYVVKCFKPFYEPFAVLFNFLFKYTIPPPPEDEVESPEDAQQYNLAVVLFACFMSFAWLALLSEGIYVLVLYICYNTDFLQPVTVGGIFLAVGAQVHF